MIGPVERLRSRATSSRWPTVPESGRAWALRWALEVEAQLRDRAAVVLMAKLAR
ncbi:MAG: hypothetical protein HYY04_12255 [Chloroflexi bacterium]|nr:hypothetical protein [Chloroflexota bacterium]